MLNYMLKVQFGCGGNQLEGFKNHDSDVDISKPLPYGNDSVDFIFIEHCLEHVNSHQATDFLKEALRILKPRGVIRICVPQLRNIRDRAHALGLIYGHGHQMIYSLPTLERMLWAVGFSSFCETSRHETDGHYRVIGSEKDDMETLRMEAMK